MESNRSDLCSFVTGYTDDGPEPAFSKDPKADLEGDAKYIRCTKGSVLQFQHPDDKELYCACPMHAPKDMLKALDIEIPDSRTSSDIINA